MAKFHLRDDHLMRLAAEKGDLTGYAIARRSGLAQSTVSRLRRGLVEPATTSLIALAQVYGATVDELVSADPDSSAGPDEAGAAS
ncbi:helix-turn-helix domain-containing protein [Kitasatospora sp. NBC_00458]|uniref:helix-turn-helix domain-containing protein n=1 Tax=Kitasatospora sp. NBC_00458 TaxID=2903568 RepID=UPI002E1832CF